MTAADLTVLKQLLALRHAKYPQVQGRYFNTNTLSEGTSLSDGSRNVLASEWGLAIYSTPKCRRDCWLTVIRLPYKHSAFLSKAASSFRCRTRFLICCMSFFFLFSISTVSDARTPELVNISLGSNLTSGLPPCLRREARFNDCRYEASRRHNTSIWNILP